MSLNVTVEPVATRILAAVRSDVPSGGIASAWKPSLDKLWAFLGVHPDLRENGHNISEYHRVRAGFTPIDFGVEVTREFASEGVVICTRTPGGMAAAATHVGAYAALA